MSIALPLGGIWLWSGIRSVDGHLDWNCSDRSQRWG